MRGGYEHSEGSFPRFLIHPSRRPIDASRTCQGTPICTTTPGLMLWRGSSLGPLTDQFGVQNGSRVDRPRRKEALKEEGGVMERGEAGDGRCRDE
ncbi:hypothetical protein Pmani_039261 [Petrolisthes manimaculis]|uniref:Uncharacterized protein n=1 Tax=Petrolisthes manimaculis TaxID=1843537 RepID=A0AAE1NEH1_9EUCA|nr:hypothetical protein Pmani_039261 [Petrolisthes manimaculis]